jgi:hypothetical protein
MSGWKHSAVVVLSATLITLALAREKKVYGLGFAPTQQANAPCGPRDFFVSHQADSFFSNLKVAKSKGIAHYYRGHAAVASFPDSTVVRVLFWHFPSVTNVCSPLPTFNPAKVQFNVEWKDNGQVVPGKGSFVKSQEAAPASWCEDSCAGAWVYELRIDSQNVPLNDSLVIRIDAQDGTRLAEYTGRLSTAAQLQLQLPHHPDPLP